ncbi:MAG: winged helix-turn-helix transcriptional regulator [Nitrososphaerota archaeon]|nr:winged helix-turn-helix transcriptional regulator [Nitrososphaerota archaeon]MDG6967624.1 winged helix-turn-helix transcriptional regulator [Nitrososphaerota archaeon]MDG6979347.1 winged helix-turn-helix transcriptional regulator [Nitrososphaerota archaeon]
MQGPKAKSVKTYLTHFPVKSYLEADILSKETTWRIMDSIRQAGSGGITAEDIIRRDGIPASAVYATLKELYRLKYVFLYPREKKVRGERRKRYVCERGTWGKYGIDPEFDVVLKMSGALDKVMEETGQPIMKAFKEVYEAFSSRRELQKYLPTKETNVCPNCKRSHEAMEFFYAVLLRSVDLMVTESEEFRRFLVDRGYASNET